MRLKLTIKTPQQHCTIFSGVFVVNFEHVQNEMKNSLLTC